LGLVLFALLSASAESAQSLAEVAKKERERRAQAGKEGQPVSVISDKELREARGSSVSISGAETESAPGEAADETEDLPEAASRLTAKEIADLRVQ
jgi:hypothetical protein